MGTFVENHNLPLENVPKLAHAVLSAMHPESFALQYRDPVVAEL